jgi:hypothetical protein
MRKSAKMQKLFFKLNQNKLEFQEKLNEVEIAKKTKLTSNRFDMLVAVHTNKPKTLRHATTYNCPAERSNL